MTTGPAVSVVIPCYGHTRLLPRLLEALEAQETSLDFEVLVVESGGDEAARRVGGRFPGVRVLSRERRLFPGAARNRGAAEARGGVLAFVDADAVPEAGWLETLHARLLSSERIAMVSGWVGLPPGTGAAGQVLHWIEFSSFLPGLASGDRDALSSCNLLVRKADLAACGGFDEGMGMAEDLMLCRKIGRRGGGRLCFEGSTGVWHPNDVAWDRARVHLGRLGYWSGRFRTLERVSGSWLRHFPALSLALPLWRLPLIMGRLFLINNMVWMRALARLPRLAAGLAVWAGGFYRGVREGGRADDAPRIGSPADPPGVAE
ncbi:MAG: glycosyltransferase [Candidatus Aminicenantes bacterium]|nr:glycosyltransferase [Candidatus Aminicenantes bacterium]